MQISFVCSSLFSENELVYIFFGDELDFHQMGLCVYVRGLAHVANGGSGRIMSTAGLELPDPWVSQAKFRHLTSRGVGGG